MSSTAPARRAAIITCIALIPLSLWSFSLANQGKFLSRWIGQVWGPEVRTGPISSSPDYMWWDIATMLLMLAICGVASLYLLVLLVKKLLVKKLLARSPS